MATPRRRPRPSLKRALFQAAHRFDFFQAVRLLGRLRPRRRPVGRDGGPSREVVRFTCGPSLAFEPSAVRRLTPPDRAGRPASMETPVLGLTGTRGALPYGHTDELLGRSRDHRDRTPEAFLNVFQHRLVSLFYRAWERHRPALSLERALDLRRAGGADPGSPDWFADHLFALMGLGLDPLRGRGAFADEALLPFAGLLADRHRPAFALEALLRATFGLPVTVVQFVETRLRLEPGDRTTLTASGAGNALGVDLIVGDRVVDVSGTFRLRVGPLSPEQFRSLSPEAPLFRRLRELTRLFVGPGMAFEVQPVLRARDVPDAPLASPPAPGCRLGRDVWVKSLGRVQDADEVRFAGGE